MDPSNAARLRKLESENGWLKKLLAEQVLDNAIKLIPTTLHTLKDTWGEGHWHHGIDQATPSLVKSIKRGRSGLKDLCVPCFWNNLLIFANEGAVVRV